MHFVNYCQRRLKEPESIEGPEMDLSSRVLPTNNLICFNYIFSGAVLRNKRRRTVESDIFDISSEEKHANLK